MKSIGIILAFILLFGSTQTNAQRNTEKIKELVDSLSWRSISITCKGTILVMTHSNKVEKELLAIGKQATPQLISALSNPSKTAIAHIVLSQIWDAAAEQNNLWTKYIYKNCNKIDGWHHIYNGLVWEWQEETDYTIKPKEVEKIKSYWISKLVEKKPTVKLSNRETLDKLEKQDEIDFPCNKVYGNSSASVKYADLFGLLNKKSNEPGFEAMWTKFGNDSTMSVHNDCFYITYDAEGLSFRFDKDSVLTTIFVEKGYRGELPYNLKLTDLMATVNLKVGAPSKTDKPYDDIYNTYKEQHLFLTFDKKGKITQFGISAD